MEKYKEIVESLGLNKFLNEHFVSIYSRLTNFSSQVIPENLVRITDETKKGLVTLASASIQVGSNLTQFRKTKEMVIDEGIFEERISLVITAASLTYMIDMAIGRFNKNTQSGESNLRLLYQALDFLNREEVRYLGLERTLAL